MAQIKYISLLISFLLIACMRSAPVPADLSADDNFCGAHGSLKYEPQTDYIYSYSTNTKLWINPVSQASASDVKLSATATIRQIRDCTFRLRLDGVSVEGESVNDVSGLVQQLQDAAVFFRFNQHGQIHPNIEFDPTDNSWSRNIKRGILSSLQTLSTCRLSSVTPGGDDATSALIYETDFLGRCRTTYSTASASDSSNYDLVKTKSLHSCQESTNIEFNAQTERYRHLPEFWQGRLFYEDYECNTQVRNNVVQSSSCSETSTYKVGANRDKGVQAVVGTQLTLTSSSPAIDRAAPGDENLVAASIVFDSSDRELDQTAAQAFDVNSFLTQLCSDVEANEGLADSHSDQFRQLVRWVRTQSNAASLLAEFDRVDSDLCTIASQTFSQSLLFADSEAAFEVVLTLLDRDAFANQKYTTEYPILTALTRTQNPSINTINRVNTYIAGKSSEFPYLRKLYLIQSTLIRIYCQSNTCSDEQLNEWTSVFSAQLGTKGELLNSALKAIGNIGYLSSPSVLTDFAAEASNSLESRVNALQALRHFASCADFDKAVSTILRDDEQDVEVRINAFLQLVRCTDTEEFAAYAERINLREIFEKEHDIQLLSFIVDYARERGLTLFLNSVLSSDEVRERFESNFKETSFDYYRYRYSVIRDAGYEFETTVIYADQSFIPRSVRFNVTLHGYGHSANIADLSIRFQGLTDTLKAIIVDHLRSEDFIQQLLSEPDQIVNILQNLADKLQFEAEPATFSAELRNYGSTTLYSELNSREKIQAVAYYIRDLRQNLLYAQTNVIKNYFILDSRIRRPLANGFEFNTFFDFSFGFFLNKASEFTQTSEGRDYTIRNSYGFSGSVNKQIEVLVDSQNRLGLRKVASLKDRLNLNVEGSKKTGKQAIYRFILPDTTKKVLTSLDGRFYKLTKNNQYIEINDFTGDRTKYELRNSENFQESFGVIFSGSVDRPSVTGLADIFTLIESDEDENDGPKVTLAGPYHYEFAIENPDRINKLIFEFNLNEATESLDQIDFTGAVKTEKQGFVQDRLQLSYVRNRVATNTGFSRKSELLVTRPSTNEVRLHLLAQLAYENGQLFHIQGKLVNRVLRELELELNVRREKSEENVIGGWNILFDLDSQVFEGRRKQYHAELNLVPEGRNINGNLLVQHQCPHSNQNLVELVNADLSLENQGNGLIDYAVQINGKSQNGKNTGSITGQFVVTLFKSNIDLNIESTRLPGPARLQLGHFFDASSNTNSYFEFNILTPISKLDHGVRLTYNVQLPSRYLNYLELRVRTPATGDKPRTYHLKRSNDASTGVYDLEIGVSNLKVDLSASKSRIAQVLTQVDSESTLRSILFTLKRTVQGTKRVNAIQVLKNGNVFININTDVYGSISALRQDLNQLNGELPRHELGASVQLKIMNFPGSFTSSLVLEAAKSRGFYNFQLNVAATDLIRILTRLVSIENRFTVENQKINAQYYVVRLGDERSLKLSAENAPIEVDGDKSSFEFNYEKKLADDTTFTSKGEAEFEFTDFKNFEVSFEVDDHFEFEIQTKNDHNENNQLSGHHELSIEYAHLDNAPFARRFNVLYDDNSGEKFAHDQLKRGPTTNFEFRAGPPGELDNVEQVNYVIDLHTDYRRVYEHHSGIPIPVDGLATVELRARALGFSYVSRREYNQVGSTLTTKGVRTREIKFPALITSPGTINFINANTEYTLNLETGGLTGTFSFETDHSLIGARVQRLNVNLVRTVNAATHTATSVVNVDVSNLIDRAQRTGQFNIESDCLVRGGACRILNIDWDQNLRPIVGPWSLDASKCSYARTFTRVKETDRYLLDTTQSFRCGDLTIFDFIILVSSDLDEEDNLPERVFRIYAQSDRYGFERGISLGHKKFSPTNGYISFGLQRHNVIHFSERLSYVRSVDPATGSLRNAEYIWTVSTGAASEKVCTMKIDASSQTTYYNALTCVINVGRAAPVQYGYALQANDLPDRPFGRRNTELTINIPGRSARFVLDGYRSSSLNDNNESVGNVFNGTLTYYPNQEDETKSLVLTATRNILENGVSRTEANLVVNGGEYLKQITFEIERRRDYDNTNVAAALGYELLNGRTNEARFSIDLHSGLRTSSYSAVESLQRPDYHVSYAAEMNKWNGKLLSAQLIGARVISLNITKDEFDIEKRRISFELNAPTPAHSVVREETFSNGVYTVFTSLSSEGAVLSTLNSTFDANYNRFDVVLNGKKTDVTYELNVAVINENLATATVTKNFNEQLARISAKVGPSATFTGIHELSVELQWNRVWLQIKEAALGESTGLQQSSKYNTYFGDVYAVLVDDLKPTVDRVRELVSSKRSSYRQFLFQLVNFYSSAVPRLSQAVSHHLAQYQAAVTTVDTTPLYVRAFRAYNRLAQRLTNLSLLIRQRSVYLSTLVPRLPVLTYNSPATEGFTNTLVITRPNLHATNLYQFYAEERNYVRNRGQNVLEFKTRSLNDNGLRNLYNKYRYRPLSDYTLVGTVFNGRNVIGFNGQSAILKARCRYLLTHELRRNEFSVILNNVAGSSNILTVAAGNQVIDLAYESASVNGAEVALPYTAQISYNRELSIVRTHKGVCLNVDTDLQVCTEAQTKSAFIGITRWYKGHLNGLLGRNQHESEHLNGNGAESYWFADASCTPSSSSVLRKPTTEARVACDALFGDNRHAQYGAASSVVNTNGWLETCERALSNNIESKCSIARAFESYAHIRRICVPNLSQCQTCNLNDKQVTVGERVSGEPTPNRDIADIYLPCPKQFSMRNSINLKLMNTNGVRYVGIIVNNQSSLYQAAGSTNFELDGLFDTAEANSNNAATINAKSFYGALYKAVQFFSQRNSNRYINVFSCGNCLPASLRNRHIARMLRKLNVRINSIGTYEIRDSLYEEEDDTLQHVAYNNKNVFNYYPEDDLVETDFTDSYRLQHTSDTCETLARKTGGFVGNIKHFTQPKVFKQFFEQYLQSLTPETTAPRKCKSFDTPFGNIVDFAYSN